MIRHGIYEEDKKKKMKKNLKLLFQGFYHSRCYSLGCWRYLVAAWLLLLLLQTQGISKMNSAGQDPVPPNIQIFDQIKKDRIVPKNPFCLHLLRSARSKNWWLKLVKMRQREREKIIMKKFLVEFKLKILLSWIRCWIERIAMMKKKICRKKVNWNKRKKNII